MSNNVDLHKAAGLNHARLTLDIDGLGRTIAFRTGGNAQNPAQASAIAGGGICIEGLYDPWLLEGEATISKDLARWLLQAYHKQGRTLKVSAVYEVFSSTDNMIIKHSFANVCLVRIPNINIDGIGSNVTLPLAFSLNDYINTQVIDA